MDYLVVAALVAGLTGIWLVQRWRTHRSQLADREWLPLGLVGAKLVWSEKAFLCESPVPMAARIDRAYRTDDRQLTLVEFKRRAVFRAYQSDVVELSVQRYVMQKAGHSVSRLAYVVVVSSHDGRVGALPVQLELARSVERRAARLVALLDGELNPHRAAHAALCSRCGHADRCPSKQEQPICCHDETLLPSIARRRFEQG